MLLKITLVHYLDDITPVRLDDQEGASMVGDKAYKNSGACWNFPFNVKDSFLPSLKRTQNAHRSTWIPKSAKSICENTALTHLPSHMESFEWGPKENDSAASPGCGVSSLATWPLLPGRSHDI